MSVDLGDRTEDSIIHFIWSTNATDGSSITRAVNGTVAVYKNDDLTQSVAGITDTEDFDATTGIHLCKIDTSADAFYAASEDYTVVLSGATIDGKSVNAVLAVFSIENRFMRGTDLAALASVCSTDAAAILEDTGIEIPGAISVLSSKVDQVPTNHEMGAAFTEIKGATWASGTDTLEAIRDRGDDAWTTGAGGSSPTVGEIRAEMEGVGTKLTLALEDTDELQTDWMNGGRLDLLLDTIPTTAMRGTDGANTTVPDAAGVAPTAAEIKTAIEAAGSSLALILADTDTTIPAQIAALNDITVADIIAGISDGTFDLQEMMRIILAATAGKSSGGGTVTLVFRDAADSKARITATVDANGNRTAMTLDGA